MGLVGPGSVGEGKLLEDLGRGINGNLVAFLPGKSTFVGQSGLRINTVDNGADGRVVRNGLELFGRFFGAAREQKRGGSQNENVLSHGFRILGFVIPQTVARHRVFTRSGLGQKTVFGHQAEILHLWRNIILRSKHNVMIMLLIANFDKYNYFFIK